MELWFVDVVSEQWFFVCEGTDTWRLSLFIIIVLKTDMVYFTSFGRLKSCLTKKRDGTIFNLLQIFISYRKTVRNYLSSQSHKNLLMRNYYYYFMLSKMSKIEWFCFVVFFVCLFIGFFSFYLSFFFFFFWCAWFIRAILKTTHTFTYVILWMSRRNCTIKMS